jgi:hypothetical protein
MNPVWDFSKTLVKHGIDKRYAPLAALYLLKLSAFEPFRLAEKLTGRRGPYEPLPHPPLFILGYYRSGTTHLQELMLCDEQLAYLNFYQGFFPTAFSSTERVVRPVFDRIITAVGMKHPAHGVPFHFRLPAEDDVAMVASGSALAANWGQVYPRAFREIYGRYSLLQGISEAERQRLGDELHGLLCRLSRQEGGRRLLLKSPPHTGRLALLRERYPRAQFVFLHRDPYDVYASNLGLWRSFEDQHLQKSPPELVSEHILWSYDQTHANYVRDKQGLGADQLVEVACAELMADPLGVVRRIDEQLGLGRFAALEGRYRAFLEREHAPRARHELPPATKATVARRWARWFEAFGYES